MPSRMRCAFLLLCALTNPFLALAQRDIPEAAKLNVEIFSAQNWWKRPGEEVLATCVDRFLSTCT